MLVDACYSGTAAFGAAEDWIRDLNGQLRFELLAAAAADRPAADGCFSRNIVRLLREGISTVPSGYLRCVDLRPLIKLSCLNQEPQHPSFNTDETLWLARNAGRTPEPWAKTPAADEIKRLTFRYQPIRALGEVVERSRKHRCLVVLGEAGAGKSALAAALAWPKVAEAVVPSGFVQAVALFTEATTPQELARAVSEQLLAVKGFREAQKAFARETPNSEQRKLGALERQVVQPLKRLNPHETVRLVFDGLDRVATGAVGSVMAAIAELAELDFVRLVITARPDTELPKAVSPKAVSTYCLPPAADDNVLRYLEGREIPDARRAEIANASEGNWLVVRVLADLLCEQPDAEIRTMGQLALGDAYEELLLRCNAASDNGAQPILEILAAAGAGPLLPLSLLCAASREFDGPGTPAGVRDRLVRLRGLAVRSAAGAEAEHAGLFHATLVPHVAAQSPDQNRSAHRAIIASIEALAPVAADGTDFNSPARRYAFEREAEHRWVLGETELALQSLSTRRSAVPPENLRRWRAWLPKVNDAFGPDHPDTLTTRGHIARWTGECGDASEASRLFRELLLDQERVLGPDHPETLATRGNIAFWIGGSGDARGALRLSKALLGDRKRLFGPDHPDTLTTRGQVAYWTGGCGDARGALRLSKALLRDRQRLPDPDHPDALTTRGLIAFWTGMCGYVREAPRLSRALLRDREHILGPDHPDTLTSRSDIASWTGGCGDAQSALGLFQSLLGDRERILGPDHPITLTTRGDIAYWTGGCGDAGEALRLSEVLLCDRERVLGLDHPDTLATRGNIAFWIGRCGNDDEALRLSLVLLPDLERVLGPAHPITLTIRYNIARWTAECERCPGGAAAIPGTAFRPKANARLQSPDDARDPQSY